MNYQLDADAARKADNRSSFIDEIGAYVGKFTRAQAITATTGTKGVAFTFQSDAGQRTDFTLYTVKPDGTQLLGYSALMAIMTCLKLKGIREAAGQVTRYDPDLGRETTVDATVYPDLIGKPIGLMLETREYEKKDGSIGQGMEMAHPFEASTNFVASEIMDRATTPEKFDKMLAGLRHRPLKKVRAPAARPAAASRPGGGGTSFDDMDDDIPF